MTVTQVLLNFRSALLAVLPSVERVRIPWKRPDAYDEWDSIATVLFESLVVQVLRWSLPDDTQDAFELPAYDLILNSYGEVSTVEVSHPALKRGRWVFHAFGTVESAFDVVEVRPLSEGGIPLEQELTMCGIEDAQFVLRLAKRLDAASVQEVAMPDD